MDKVVLSKAARQALSERLGKPIPRPDSDEFDTLLEELREMQPDLYTDVMAALEHKGEVLPVEKEALRAQKRAQRQQLADRLKNRRTHDDKRVPDKRKALVLGGVATAFLMGWIGYTNMTRGFTAQAATVAETDTTQELAKDENSFGVRADGPNLGEPIDVPEVVEVAAPPVPPPPAKATIELAEKPKPVDDTPENTPEISPAQDERATGETDSPLPYLERIANTPEPAEPVETDLPPVPGPPQPGIASAPPTPYLPGQPTPTPSDAEVEALPPGNLSFVPLEATVEGPSTVLSAASPETLAEAPATTLTTGTTQTESVQQPPTSLSPEEEGDEAPPATTLNWENSQTETVTTDASLSFDQDQDTLSTNTSTLPPVPEVGGGEPAPPAPQGSTPPPAEEPEVVNLGEVLTPGTTLQAELVTGVAAADGAGMPVIARTEGNWCGSGDCQEITWIGEASYSGMDRVQIRFSQAVVGNTAQSTTATAFDSDQLPGVRANVRDAAPTAVQDLMRGAVGGASDYLDALNSRETVFLRDGEIVTEQAEPDLSNYLLQRGAELFSLPSDQTSIVRLAEIAPGTAFTVTYGL